MANEFKIKKGLIVTGASGGTVVDIQGSQGQLFSVTDDLSGFIFAVSDISGVPILDVNSSGTSYFDGSLGIGTVNPSRQLEVVSSSGIVAVLTSTTGGSYISMEDSATTSDSEVRFGAIGDNAIIKSGGTTALSLDASQNATFAGQITTTQNQITTNIGTTSAIRLKPTSTANTTGKSSIFLGTSPVDNYGISLRGARLGSDGTPTFELATHSNSANGTVALSIDNSQNATFTGTVTASTFLGDLNGTINTATTGVTQTAGNNSTLIATTAYADAAAAAVPIGDYLPLAGGTLTGGLIGTSANFGEGVKSTDGFFNNVEGIRLLYPNGGSNNALGNSGTTGALKITLPQGWTSTMMRMTIKVYEYSESKSFTINCGGYNHSDSSAWINEFAYIESQSEVDRNFTVRFGYDSNNKCCIYIGELTSVWSYPKVFVTDFEAGFNNTVASNWQDGWVISMETTAFENVSQIRTNCQINNWKRNGQDVYYGSGTGNVGIGATNPLRKLHVVGDFSVNAGTDEYYGVLINGGESSNPAITIGDWHNSSSTIKWDSTNNHLVIDSQHSSSGSAILFTGNDSATEYMRINSSGNVGIGLTNPVDRLDLYDSDDNVGMYFHTATSGTGGGNGLRVGQNNANAFVWNYEATPLSLATSGTARLTINATGGIRFNTGYGAGTLVTDASGNITVSSGGGAGGPYLPLSAGSGSPLTGDLYVGTSTAGTDRFIRAYYSDSAYTEMRGYGIITNRAGSYYRPANDKTQVLAIGNDGNTWNYISQNANYHTFGKDTSEWMRIDTSGNVGIGTTSPAAKLHAFSAGTSNSQEIVAVLGSTSTRPVLQFSESTSGTITSGMSLEYNGNASGDANYFVINSVSNVPRFTVMSGGNVGIGTTSPAQPFQVDAGSNIASFRSVGTGENNKELLIQTGGDRVTLDAKNADDGTATSLAFELGNSEKARLTTTGLGIGTTSPSQKLDVNGYARATGGFVGSSGLKLFGDNSSTNFAFVSTGGNVGIGTTSPSNKLSLAGSGQNWTTSPGIKMWDSYNSKGWYVGSANNATSGDFYIRSVTTEGAYPVSANKQFTIKQSGNVGIGTTSPNEKLDVLGKIYIESQGVNWNETTPGLVRGALHFDPVGDGADNTGNAITFGASDASAGTTGQAGIYTRSDGTYGTKMYFATTDSYNSGSKTRMMIDFNGNVGIGTTSPNDKLHVNGTVRSQAPATSDWALLGYNSAGSSSSGLWFENGSGDILLRRSDNSLQTRIRSAGSSYINGGSLGLGTTSPAQKLTVNSGRMLVSNTTTPIYIKAGSTYKSWVHHIGGSDGYIFAPSTADNGETWDWANQTKLGANGVVTAKNFQLSSDERFKNNIKDIKDIKVEAAFKSFEMESSPGEKRYGVVAQELEKTNPELVETDHEGFKSVKYIDLLIAKIAELEARLEKLEK